ncbi:unnamed protein product [Rotaria magnacalcarata]|uniref:BED-type domain-containing protein n=1 Tax=Rotaria magnacalcarata TaxID=392030 RepID=A0A816SWV3_9BILA|nr:unnamed protein product [Rotaria magnacalcarata]CAF4105740.1 unnamed protein product [Rotaria magnacalcarata]
MASKTNKNHDDSATLSSSSAHSPYNLRRNQSQPGGVTKRNSSLRSKKNIHNVNAQTSNSSTSSTTSLTASNQPQSSSSGDEEVIDDNNANEIELSDDEPEAMIVAKRIERKQKKLPPAKDYFEHIDDNNYLCQICLKLIKISSNSDANLRSHLGRAHNMPEMLFDSQRNQSTANPKQIKPEKKRELHQAAIDCIITDGRAFGDFRRLGMSKFLNVICPGYRGPGRKTVRRRLGILYHEYRQKLREVLASIPAVAITVDIWTKKKKSFICLTGHAFNKKYESIPLVLGFRRFTGSHESENIKKYILYELQRLNIQDKICGIVGDNGSDIKKAINEIKPGERFSCTAHNINLVVKNGLGLWEKMKKKTKQPPRTTIDVIDHNSDDNDTSSDFDHSDIPDEFEDDEDNLTYSNAADSDEEVNNAVDDEDDDEDNVSYAGENDNQDDNEENDDYQSIESIDFQDIRASIRQLIDRMRAFINNNNSTRAVTDYVQQQEKIHDPPITAALVTDIEIRWNTTFITVDRFVTHQGIIDDINSRPFKIPNISSVQQLKLGNEKFEFTNDEWCTIKDLQTVLKPFFGATNTVSAKNYPTLALAYSSK